MNPINGILNDILNPIYKWYIPFMVYPIHGISTSTTDPQRAPDPGCRSAAARPAARAVGWCRVARCRAPGRRPPPGNGRNAVTVNRSGTVPGPDGSL